MPRWETLRETTVEVAAGTPHAAQQPEKRRISVSPFPTGRVPLFQRGEKIIRIIHHNEGSNVLWVDKSRVTHALEGVHKGGPETVNVVEHNRPGDLAQLLEGEYFTEFFPLRREGLCRCRRVAPFGLCAGPWCPPLPAQ